MKGLRERRYRMGHEKKLHIDKTNSGSEYGLKTDTSIAGWSAKRRAQTQNAEVFGGFDPARHALLQSSCGVEQPGSSLGS
jgi:hypothetical protein